MDDIIEQKLDQNDATNSESQAMVEILDWSKNIPAWQQDALRRLCQNGELDDIDIEELTILCKNNGKDSIPLYIQDLRNPEVTANTVNLLEIRDTCNVNALKPGELLTFCKSGMTVVYGDNGSGKSGYVRILKQVCRARKSRKESEILPNINANDSTQQKAVIRYSINGHNKSEDWRAETPANPWLSAISVFDTDAANVHVERENEVAYTPFPVKVLERLADACQKVENLISKEIRILEEQTPATITNPRCSPSTTVGKFLSDFTGETNEVKVHELAKLSEDEKLRLTELNNDLNNDSTLLARHAEAREKQLEEFNSALDNYYKGVSDDQACKLIELHRSYEIAKNVANIAAKRLFGQDPLPEIGSEVWRKLWEAARSYSEMHAYSNSSFPYISDNARCVLCQQELDDEAMKRMVRFEEFVKDNTKQKEALAKSEYEAALNEVRNVNISAIKRATVLRLIRDELNDNELAIDVHRCIATLRLRRFRIVNNSGTECSSKLLPVVELQVVKEGVHRHINLLRTRIKLLLEEEESEARKKNSLRT